MTDDIKVRLERALRKQLIDSYMMRGRRLETISDDELKSGWATAFELWVDQRTKENEYAELDYQGEMAIRGISISALDWAPEAHHRLMDEIHSRPNWRDRALSSPALDELIAKMDEEPH